MRYIESLDCKGSSGFSKQDIELLESVAPEWGMTIKEDEYCSS